MTERSISDPDLATRVAAIGFGATGQNGSMVSIDLILGDITTVAADAIVNAADNQMRGGGGVDGAIHRAGGSTILADCVSKFPNGLATGDAGWTTAGNLPAKWVIHTVGPNYSAGETDRGLLVSCYRRALEVADELGARSIAFPLISAGVYGWPKHDAALAAVETIASTSTSVDSVKLVAFDERTLHAFEAGLSHRTPLRLLQGVRVLHDRGYHAARVFPGMSASGMYWRVSISPATTSAGGQDGHVTPPASDQAIRYSTSSLREVASGTVDITTSPEDVADLLARELPTLLASRAEDPPYVEWYSGLLQLVERHDALPVAYADYFDDEPGWEVGWGSGIRYPHPPAPNA